ncbi:glutaredoxin 3 [Marivibrio halodurans]|uniref:Glutaredoxin n=1 Tax=Marivibrio halodurans TaxID=2039722 RepID=A0A8J7V2J8_9PROT|nr:glutaredoxin 3 [Marivibrio halodurans]MBP5857400.1 glutaredoxin 3 [Marivibrio halodurans]
MAHVEIYTRPMCGFCFKAKKLLGKKSIDFVEYNIWEEDGRKDEMTERTGGATTVPQVFIDGKYVGDCDKLHRLDDEGELDKLLASAA